MRRPGLLKAKRTPTVRNIHPRPAPRFTSTSTSPLAWRSSSQTVAAVTDVTGPTGELGIRYTRLQADTSIALYNGFSGGSLWRTDKGNLRAGDTWTIIFDARSDIEMFMNSLIGYGAGSQSHDGAAVGMTVTPTLQTFRRVWNVTQEQADRGTGFLKWSPSLVGVGNWVEIYRVCVVFGVYLGPSLSGYDYTMRWDGTENASESVGYAPSRQLIRNLHPRGSTPSLNNGWASQTPSGSTVTYEANTGPTGGPAMTVVTTAAGQLRMGMNDQNAARRIPVTPGERYTVAAWLYSPRVMSGVSFETQFVDVLTGSGLFIGGTTFSVVPGWQFVRSFVTAPAGRSAIGVAQVLSPASAPNRAEVGDTYRLARGLIMAGEYQGDYVDGDTPGWRWEGAVGASASTGYPYTLESVLAGRPVLHSVKDAPAGTSLTIPQGPFTILAVQDARSASNNPGYYEYGAPTWSATLGRRRLIGSGSTTRMDQMRSTGLGIQNFPMTAVGLHIMQSTLTDTGSRFWYEDRTTLFLLSSANAFPMDGTLVRIGVRDNGVQNAGVAETVTPHFIVLPGDLSLADTLPIRQWLANKHGFALAA